jgi:hypothetical protein
MASLDPRNSAPGAAWSSATPPTASAEPALARFLGGSPAAVFLRLLLLSFLVGALLMWLDIRPQDVILGFERFFRRIWALGFRSLREALEYVAAGALIVVPVWLFIRLMRLRDVR